MQFPLGSLEYRQLFDPETGGSRAEIVSLVPLFRDKRTASDMAELEGIERKILNIIELCQEASAETRSSLDSQIVKLESINQRLGIILEDCQRLAEDTRHESYRF